jgi:cobalt-zinc-cadmium efflux system outer membrane protein
MSIAISVLAADPPAKQLRLDDLVQLGLARHPKLQQAEYAVEAARGLAIQAGLRPNPVLAIYGDEINDRTGPAGIWNPMFTQEIVTKRKIPLQQAAASRGVDQATWQVVAQRATLLTSIRQAFYDLLATQARIDIQNQLVRLGEVSVATVEKMEAGRQSSRIDVLQLSVELERFRADAEAAKSELPATYRQLAASIGVAELPALPIIGVLEAPLPIYDLDSTRQLVLTIHPEVQAARIGVEKARLLLARAQAEPCPNVTLGAGYTYQGQNRSSDVAVSMSMPIPVHDRNQGNIRAAHAALGEAIQDVNRVEVNLAERVATAFREYTAAKQKAERFRDNVLPKARELVELALQAQAAGQFETLKVLEAQRSVENAKLDYIKSLGEAWKAAAALAGLTLEENWPPSVQPAPQAPERQQGK